MKILWFIPTHGDSRYLGSAKGARTADFAYFKQIAIAADSLGYEGVLIPTGRSCEDSWILAASLIDATRHLWAGVGLVRGGAGTALVGSAEQVAARIKEYAALGLDYFVLSGYPHLDEAHRFAELVFPLLPLELQRKLPGRALTGPFGEIVASDIVPGAAPAQRQESRHVEPHRVVA